MTADAEQRVTETARLMLETAYAMRTYTTTQVAPLMEREQTNLEQSAQNMQHILDVEMPAALRKAMAKLPPSREQQILHSSVHDIQDSARRTQKDMAGREVFPQSIPFYAATEAFNYFRQKFPDFTYEEAALNPTNPRDRTADWEADIVNSFRKNPSKMEFSGRRETPAGISLYLATPIRVDSETCLACHGPAEKAPPEIVKLYGAGNGFGWRLDDVTGAQIVSVPADIALNQAAASTKAVSLWLGGIFSALFLLVNAIVFVFISRLVPAQMRQ